MSFKVKKDEFTQGLKTVGKLINNKVVALDTSYLKISYVNGSYWLAGFGSQHELLIKLNDKKGTEKSKNIDFSYLWDLIGFMDEDITIDLTEKGVMVKDNRSKTELMDLMGDNDDDDVEDIKELIKMKEKEDTDGIEVNREDLFNTLNHLRSIQEREDREDLETGIMLTEKAGYVVSEVYAARYYYEFPMSLVLDTHTVKVLLDLLDKNKVDTMRIIRDDEGFTWFLVGDDFYRVDGLLDEVDDEYEEVFKHREVKDTLTLDKNECLRMLNMTRVLVNSSEPDINFSIKKGKGRIFTETGDGDIVDSKFDAKNCQDVDFTVSVEDLVSVISNLPKNVGNELYFEVVLIPMEEQDEEQELLHLKYENKENTENEDDKEKKKIVKGDCIFSINTDLD